MGILKMIRLKNKINKTEELKKIKTFADDYYKDCYEEELRKEAFLVGAEHVLKILQLKTIGETNG
jgi:hypothetical protein